MSRLFNISQLLFAPADSNTDDGGALNRDSILDILEAPDPDDDESLELKEPKEPKKEDKKEEKVKDDKKTDEKNEDDEEEVEIDPLDEEEQDLEDPTEEELELVTPVRRKEILKKYPEVFKDFPYLEKAYYREQKYTEIFPTLEDARVAQESKETLTNFEQKIVSGDISSILKVVKEDSPEAFTKIVDNYLDTLKATDEKSFFHVVNSVLKPVIWQMASNGRASDDEELQKAALVLNKFMYGSSKFEPHKKMAETTDSRVSDEEKKIQAERNKLFEDKFNSAQADVTKRVESAFKKTIEKYIDEKNHMTDYVRKQAARDAYEQLTDTLKKDSRYRAVLDKAWRKAADSNFSEDSLKAVRAVINARATTVLPSVIKRARIEALKGLGRKVRQDDDNSADKDKSGRSTSSTNRGPLKQRNGSERNNNNEPNKIPNKMSNRDFIMGGD